MHQNVFKSLATRYGGVTEPKILGKTLAKVCVTTIDELDVAEVDVLVGGMLQATVLMLFRLQASNSGLAQQANQPSTGNKSPADKAGPPFLLVSLHFLLQSSGPNQFRHLDTPAGSNRILPTPNWAGTVQANLVMHVPGCYNASNDLFLV